MLRVGQIAARAGLKPSAVRYYESLGLLHAVRVSGRRLFAEVELSRLQLIGAARDASFSLDQIRGIVGGTKPDWRDAAAAKLRDLDAELERIQRQREAVTRMLGCECDSIKECASKSLANQAAASGFRSRRTPADAFRTTRAPAK
jgi:MerR family redox-sensitive transcriptional activator SoxR